MVQLIIRTALASMSYLPEGQAEEVAYYHFFENTIGQVEQLIKAQNETNLSQSTLDLTVVVSQK